MQAPPLSPVSPSLRDALATALNDEVGFAKDFYQRLFELAPAVRALFPADLAAQQHKLGRSLTMLVKCLEQPETLQPELRQLGARHLRYGVEAPHYLVVGQALAEAVVKRLGAPLSPSLQQQWQQLYGWIAATMLGGALAAASAPAATP
jgi:hemoglobin-like flavoprotein